MIFAIIRYMETLTPTRDLSLAEKLTKYSWSKWKPTYVAKRVEALGEAFENEELPDVEHVAFDVDGTLMDYHEGQLEPQIVEMFQGLLARGLRVSIISNAYGSRVQELREIFRAVDEEQQRIIVITPEDVAREGEDPKLYRKPDPTMFYKLAELTGVAAENTLVVGDQLMKDIVTANTVGAQSLIVERRGDGDDERVARWQRPIERLARRAIHGIPVEWTDFPAELTRVEAPESGRGWRLRRVLGRGAAQSAEHS